MARTAMKIFDARGRRARTRGVRLGEIRVGASRSLEGDGVGAPVLPALRERKGGWGRAAGGAAGAGIKPPVGSEARRRHVPEDAGRGRSRRASGLGRGADE